MENEEEVQQDEREGLIMCVEFRKEVKELTVGKYVELMTYSTS